jgi:hypothetical protein
MGVEGGPLPCRRALSSHLKHDISLLRAPGRSCPHLSGGGAVIWQVGAPQRGI